MTANASAKQALMESEVKARDLQRENAILRESNEKLLDSAYNVERERHFVASENALKVQVAQLESTLKADLRYLLIIIFEYILPDYFSIIITNTL